MNDGYSEDPYTSPFHTDDDGELPRAGHSNCRCSPRATSCTCQWCGKPLPAFLRAKHEEHCERRPANEFEAMLRWHQARRMAQGDHA